MRHLNQWIIHELCPSRAQNSKTTNSYYYTVNNITIRMSDHIGTHDNPNINIIVTKDVTSFKKKYILLYDKPQTMNITINNVADLKIILKVILCQYFAISNTENAKKEVETYHKIAIQKLHERKELSGIEIDCLYKHIIKIFPGYSLLTKKLKDLYKDLIISGLPLSEINKLFIVLNPNLLDGKGLTETEAKDTFDILSKKYLINTEEHNAETVNIENKKIEEIIDNVSCIDQNIQEQIKNIINNPYKIPDNKSTTRCLKNLINCVETLFTDKEKFITERKGKLGSFICIIFGQSALSKLSKTQKHDIFNMDILYHIPYEYILKFYETFCNVPKKQIIKTDKFSKVVEKFVNTYNNYNSEKNNLVKEAC